jgi:DNA recombination protein RmuC
MELAAVVALALLIVILIAAVVRYGRTHDGRSQSDLAVVQRALQGDVALLQNSIADLGAANTEAVAQLRSELQRSLGETEQQLLTHSGTTQRALSEVAEQLVALSEQGRRVGELAKDIGSLHDLLRAPKVRGGFGEVLMHRVLEDRLPAEAYALQYTYRDGSRVDAVIRLGGRLIPIDAKFPLDAFNALAAAADDEERQERRRAFVHQVKRHVDAVARYVSPEEGTIDYCLMYIPAEAIYYEAVVREGGEVDLRDYCARRNVVPTSPNTLLAYIQLVALALRGLAIEERAREVHEGIRQVAVQVERFRGLHDVVGRHLQNAYAKWGESDRALDRASDAIAALGSSSAAARQPELLAAESAVESLESFEEVAAPGARRE